MQDKIIFREMLSELKKYADEKHNVLTQQEIRDFLKHAGLTDEQYQFIYEYLTSQNIRVEGYLSESAEAEDGAGAEKTNLETDDVFLNMYLEDLESSVKTVLPEEELKLFWQAAEEDAMAKSRLVELNLRRVYQLVKEYDNSELSKSDLIQEGNICLMLVVDALERLETLEEYHSYLEREVRKVLHEAEQEQRDLKHMNQQVVEQVNYLNEAIRNLEEDFGRKVSIEELSAYLEMPAEEIKDILRMAGDEIELGECGHEHRHVHE